VALRDSPQRGTAAGRHPGIEHTRRACAADGVASGEFRLIDVNVAANCTCAAMLRFFHPQLIADCADKPEPTLDRMIDFVIAALRGQRIFLSIVVQTRTTAMPVPAKGFEPLTP
jgi:hypothetical protein